jgi:hypothetical protein
MATSSIIKSFEPKNNQWRNHLLITCRLCNSGCLPTVIKSLNWLALQTTGPRHGQYMWWKKLIR